MGSLSWERCPWRVDEAVPVSGVYGAAPAEARADMTADRPEHGGGHGCAAERVPLLQRRAVRQQQQHARQAAEVARGHQARPPAPAVRGRGPAPTAGEGRAKQFVVAPRGGAERQRAASSLHPAWPSG
jgi:hypothetical protein